MKFNIIRLAFLTLVLFIFTSSLSTCKGDSNVEIHSNIQARITEKEFLKSICSDKKSNALSIKISTILQNTSKISGAIDDWKLDFHSDSVLLLSMSKSNYDSFACGTQKTDMTDEIITTGFFNFFGFVKFSLLNNTVPNKVIIKLTIKDKSGHTYQITDTY